MKHLLCLLLLVLSLLGSRAQTRRIDSLKKRVRSAVSPPERLRCLLELCQEDETLPEDTLWSYAQQADALAARMHDGPAHTLSILSKASAYIRWGNTDSASVLIGPELTRYRVAVPAERDLYFRLEGTKINLMRNKGYKNVLSEVYATLHAAELYKDSLTIAESMNTLGALNYDLDMLPQSTGWLFKALRYCKDIPVFDEVTASIYLTLSDNYWWIGKEDSALYFVNKADRLSTRSQNLYLLSVGAQKRATVFIRMGRYQEAEQAIHQSLAMIAPIEGKVPQPDKLVVLASVYEHEKLYDKAIEVLNQGLHLDSLYRRRSVHHPDKAHDRDFQTLFYHQELANCYKLKGDHQHYENLLEKIIAEKDADYQASSASAIAELETRYQFQKKEELISRQKLQLAHRNLMLYSALLVLVLGSVIVWLVFKAYRRRQSVRAALAVNEAGESERKRISADLHDNLGAQISFIKRNVEFLIDQPEGFKAADQSRYLGHINDFANSAMIDLRETIWVLNKNEVYLTEFTDKLRFYLFQQLQVAAPVNWELVDDIRLNWKLTSTEVMHLFRIMQELVSNILQHARADQIRIRLTSDQIQHYRLEVTDNGCGFDADQPPPGHYGLVNLRQRAMELGAALELRSLPGKGTRVILDK